MLQQVSDQPLIVHHHTIVQSGEARVARIVIQTVTEVTVPRYGNCSGGQSTGTGWYRNKLKVLFLYNIHVLIYNIYLAGQSR